MSRPISSSPWLTIALALALAVSLAFHAVGTGDGGAEAPRVVAFEVSGPELRPTLLVDFDAEMIPPDGTDEVLEPGVVTLDPPLAVEAAFVTPRRLRVRPTVGLPPFTTFHVRFGDGFADALGRAVDPAAGPALTFQSSVFGLVEPPATGVGARGDDVQCELAFNGPVRQGELEQHLRLETRAGEAIPFTVRGGGCDWTVRPERLEADGAVLVIGGGLAHGRGGAPDQPDRRYGLTWPTALRVTDVRVRGTDGGRRIELRFSHHLADQDPAPYVVVEPAPADLSVEIRDSRLILHGRFAPRRTVDVRVRKGLRAAQGLSLGEDVVRFALIPPVDPFVRFARRGRTLSTAALPELEIEGVNVSVVDVAVHEVHTGNVVPLALRWRQAPALARDPRTKRIAVEAPLDEAWTRRVDLAAVLGAAPRGIYHVEVGDPQQPHWRRAARLIQVTDLAPVVRVRPDRLVVLVTRLSDGSAVGGARVEAFDEKNQSVASGSTDEQGLLVVPATAPFVVTVSTDDDRAYVDLRTHGLAHDARAIEGRAPATGLEAFVYSDRGVVRPGETCRVGALVRTPAGLAPADRLPLELRLRAPDERVVRTWTRRTDAHGVIALDVPFLPDAPTGPYRVDVVGPGLEETLGRVSFRVEAIVPDRIEPALVVPPGDLRFGDTVTLGLGASLLTGRPAPALQARVRVRYAPDPAPPVDGFAFGDVDAAPKPFGVDLADVRLDAQGRATVEARLPEANPSGLPLRAVFELEVVDVSGRASFVRETRRVVPAGARLGLAVPADDAWDVPVVVAGAQEVAGTATLERLRWEGGYVFERGRAWPVWRAELSAHVVQTRPFALASGRGLVRFDDPGDGRYRVRVRAEGVGGASIRLDRWGGSTQRSTDDGGAPRLELRLVEEAVPPGGTATVQVDAPFAGRGLLTLEGPGTLEARVVDVRAGLQSFEVAVPDAPAPNLHATLTALRGARQAGDGNTRVLGAVRVPIARPERRLEVGLDVPERAVPGTHLVVGVRTARPATVRVHLVDEGILRLTGYRTPDPQAFLEAPRRLDTRLADAYTALLEGMRFAGDDPEPGGGEGVLAERLDPTARKTIETIALASALVACDDAVQLTFEMPEQYEGRLRVFVVAAGEASTGVASAPLVLEAPVSVAVHVPRAVAPGDVFEVPVRVRGDEATWEVTLDGLERVSAGDGLRVRASDRMGVASVVVHATDAAGNETTRRARLAVRPPAPYVVQHEVRRLGTGETAEQDLPGSWLAGHRRARLTVGAPGLLDLLPALDRLLEYPYGCVEQTTSRAFPLLALAELARAGHPEGDAPRDTVAACIDRILAMQTSDGGLATWPGGSRSYPYGSAYAAHFLLEARRFGRPVPERPLAALLDYLERRLHGGAVDAYTARVLALGGRGVVPFLERLAEEATRAEDVANLAAAYLLTGDRARADAMLAEAGDPWAAPTRHGGTLDSPLRAAATLLSALVDVRPEDERVPELVERLSAAACARPRSGATTQTDAAVLLALAKAHGVAGSRAHAVRGVLRAGGREHAFDGTDGLVVTVDAEDPWRVGLTADGPVTLVVRTEGIPREAPAGEVEHGIRVTRRIVAPAGPLRQGRVYEVVIEGRVPEGCENLLVTDVLPGGLEIEAARDREGTLEPDRIEPRDDRVLFFRTQPLTGEFRQTYLVRAVTVGRFHVPPVSAELLYAPAVYGRSSGGGTLEIVR